MKYPKVSRYLTYFTLHGTSNDILPWKYLEIRNMLLNVVNMSEQFFKMNFRKRIAAKTLEPENPTGVVVLIITSCVIADRWIRFFHNLCLMTVIYNIETIFFCERFMCLWVCVFVHLFICLLCSCVLSVLKCNLQFEKWEKVLKIIIWLNVEQQCTLLL